MRTLLIVEDEWIIRKALMSLDWSAIGVSKVYTAENGKQGIEYFKKYRPQVVLTDINMPFLDGLSMGREVSGISKCQLIFLTGYSDFSYAQEAINLKAFDYILKPVDTAVLLPQVDNAFQLMEEDSLSEMVLQEVKKRYPTLCLQNLTSLELQGLFLSETSQGWTDSTKKENGLTNIIIQQAKQYINIHYADETISLQKVADFIHVTPPYLSNLFKTETGKNYTEYIFDCRMNKARQLLLDTQKTITEIAIDTGFANPNYFSSCFRKEFGLSPKQFRNMALTQLTK